MAMVERAFSFLGETSPRLLREAGIDLEQIEELSVDMRSYDHGHPANLRPNQVFGEWDPARIDLKGRFSRLVVRKLIMEAIEEWSRFRGADSDADHAISESAAVLCGTILMASGVSGGKIFCATRTPRGCCSWNFVMRFLFSVGKSRQENSWWSFSGERRRWWEKAFVCRGERRV